LDAPPALPWTHTKCDARTLQVLLGESTQEHLIGSFQDSLQALEGLAALAGVDKVGLLSAKSHCLHRGPTLTLGELPPSATRDGPGSTLVDKLQAILLMEGNFNFFNKWLFGHVAVSKLYNSGYIPEDQYSKKSITAEDSKLDNHLTMDLLRWFRQLLVAVSAKADKCYDQINHIIMSLVLLAIGGEDRPISAMLHPIQQMRFFQCTGWGDSDTFMGNNQVATLCKAYAKEMEPLQHVG
jgi:hypothetical protein